MFAEDQPAPAVAVMQQLAPSGGWLNLEPAFDDSGGDGENIQGGNVLNGFRSKMGTSLFWNTVEDYVQSGLDEGAELVTARPIGFRAARHEDAVEGETLDLLRGGHGGPAP